MIILTVWASKEFTKVNLKEQLDNYKECHIIAIDEMGSYTGETSPLK